MRTPSKLEVIDVDRYKREVGRIYLGDGFVNMEMVADGFAWRYVQYDRPGEFTRGRSRRPRARAGLVGRSESGAPVGMAARKGACAEGCSLRSLLRTGHAGLMLHAPSAPVATCPSAGALVSAILAAWMTLLAGVLRTPLAATSAILTDNTRRPQCFSCPTSSRVGNL